MLLTLLKSKINKRKDKACRRVNEELSCDAQLPIMRTPVLLQVKSHLCIFASFFLEGKENIMNDTLTPAEIQSAEIEIICPV